MIIFGSTGMLGQALIKAAKHQGFHVTGVARHHADVNLDVSHSDKLKTLILHLKPKTIINCIAITDIHACEENQAFASSINSEYVSHLVDICRSKEIHLVHISTDHFYTNSQNKKHAEEYPITLLNHYAKTKYRGEVFALNYARALVIRTNIVGYRNHRKPTFVEWVLSSLKNKNNITVFNDFYTSSIDVYHFSDILLSLLSNKKPVYGLYNIASSDVCSKEVFIKKIAEKFHYPTTHCSVSSIQSLKGTKRAESLGLDVSKIERLLGSKMPSCDQVIDALYKHWKHHD